MRLPKTKYQTELLEAQVRNALERARRREDADFRMGWPFWWPLEAKTLIPLLETACIQNLQLQAENAELRSAYKRVVTGDLREGIILGGAP